MSVEQLKEKRVVDKSMSDAELLHYIQQGDNYALNLLIMRYKNFVRAKAQTYFLIGADREDIFQEGMIGLYKAIRDYNATKLASFKAFAELCVTRQIITAIKTATRQKHLPLNSYVSLDKPIFDEEQDRTLLDIVEGDEAIDPQELLINRERFGAIELKLSDVLSGLERRALHLYLDGRTYQEISELLNRHVKSIDNALQRVKKKLEEIISTNELT